MALPRYMYSDPQEVAIRKQEYELRTSCRGCAFYGEEMGIKQCDLKPREKQARIRKCNLWADKRKEGDK